MVNDTSFNFSALSYTHSFSCSKTGGAQARKNGGEAKEKKKQQRYSRLMCFLYDMLTICTHV